MTTFYDSIKPARAYDAEAVRELLRVVSEERVRLLAANLSAYLAVNLLAAIQSKDSLADYRTNPYVLMTTASTMKLSDPERLAEFLVNLKLYMGLETSFGKSIESIVLPSYPLAEAEPAHQWMDAPEKIAEFQALEGLDREDRARARNESKWREIDRVCIVGRRRYLMTVKSGPATINDTQVAAMKDAIRDHHLAWLQSSVDAYDVDGIDVVIGLTYGTERSTNNKENQILAKLLVSGFGEVNREEQPGVLQNADGSVRVYRVVGSAFWSFVGNPVDPRAAEHVSLEVLLALAKALNEGEAAKDIEEALGDRVRQLATAIQHLESPREALPAWIRGDFSEGELAWLAAAMSAFFDAPAK